MTALAKGLAKGLTTTVIFLLLVEGLVRGAYFVRNSMVRYVPLPYALGDEYGPIPPWLDRLLILVSDDTLIWKSAANVHRIYVDIFSPVRTERDRIALLRRFTPTLPDAFQSNPRWEIALNSHGDRSPEVAAAPRPATIRVACIGDSWTFGMNVNQDATYPSRLAAWLGRQHPDRQFEVINFGVLGYSSFQGLQLLERRVLDLHANIVVIGFGMNDSEVAGYRDKDMVGAGPRPSIRARVTEAAAELEFYKLLKFGALVMKFRPRSTGDYLKEEAEAKSSPVDYDTIEPWTRVSPQDYERNIREMIRLTRGHGASAILVDNELWGDSPYRPVLRRIAGELHVPLVDSYAIVDEAKRRIERQLEDTLGVNRAEPPSSSPVHAVEDRVSVVFRVHHGSAPVPNALSIVGSDPQLGSFAPNTVAMHDDGTNGDETAGDGVWSYRATFQPGARLVYLYTNSGGRGRWEGLDVPHIRSVQVPAANGGRPVYLPIETFGRLYMQADNWHTDASGYDLIAHAVADAIDVNAPQVPGR